MKGPAREQETAHCGLGRSERRQWAKHQKERKSELHDNAAMDIIQEKRRRKRSRGNQETGEEEEEKE